MTERVGFGQPWKELTDIQLVRAASANLGTKYINGTTSNKLLSSSIFTTPCTHFLFSKNWVALFIVLEIMFQSSRKGRNTG